jgi:hypothetical protein
MSKKYIYGRELSFKENSIEKKIENLLIKNEAGEVIFPQSIYREQLKEVGLVSEICKNGLNFTRKSSKLCRKFQIKKNTIDDGTVNEIVFINYIDKEPNKRTPVPLHVRKSFSKLKNPTSALSGLNHNLEIDHKDGHLGQGSDIEDFQLLTKNENDTKRDYCNKICIPNKKRYDARIMGYKVGWVNGNENLQVELGKDACKGCFRHDPVFFRKHLFFKQNSNNISTKNLQLLIDFDKK